MNGALIQTNKLLRNFYTLCAVLNSGEAERLGIAAKAAKERITILSNSDLEHGHTIRFVFKKGHFRCHCPVALTGNKEGFALLTLDDKQGCLNPLVMMNNENERITCNS